MRLDKHLHKLFLPLLISLVTSDTTGNNICWKATKIAFNLQKPLVEAKSGQLNEEMSPPS